MPTRYDHFHAGLKLKNGQLYEVEGGWTGQPYSNDEDLIQIAISWDGDIKREEVKELAYFRLGG